MGEVLEAASFHLLCGGIVAKNFMGEFTWECGGVLGIKFASWASFCLSLLLEDYFSHLA